MGLAEYFREKQPIIEQKMQHFHETLSSRLPLEGISPSYIQEALYAITSDALRGGKRTRLLLVYLGHELVGGQCPVLDELAILPEIGHKGSVMIDGIEDDDPKVGDCLTLHRKYGIPLAINAGTFLCFFPYIIIQHASIPSLQKWEITDLYSQTALQINQAQALDIYWRQNKILPSEEEYLEMNCLKASSLTFSAVMGAILGDATQTQRESLGSIVSDMATAYQLKDDVIDEDALLPQGRAKELAVFFVEKAEQKLIAAFPHSPTRDILCELVRYCGIDRTK